MCWKSKSREERKIWETVCVSLCTFLNKNCMETPQNITKKAVTFGKDDKVGRAMKAKWATDTANIAADKNIWSVWANKDAETLLKWMKNTKWHISIRFSRSDRRLKCAFILPVLQPPTWPIEAIDHKNWSKLLSCLYPLLRPTSIYIMDLSHTGLSLQNPLNNVVVFMKWLMNRFLTVTQPGCVYLYL